jgi:hypothetical protein
LSTNKTHEFLEAILTFWPHCQFFWWVK